MTFEVLVDGAPLADWQVLCLFFVVGAIGGAGAVVAEWWRSR